MEKGETRIKRVRKEIDYDATSRGDGVGGYRVRRTRVSTSAIPVLEAATATKSDDTTMLIMMAVQLRMMMILKRLRY